MDEADPKPETDRIKRLNDAWSRFDTRISGVRASLASLVTDLQKRRKMRLLDRVWARFRSKMTGIRGRTRTLMAEIDRKRSRKEIEKANLNLENT